MRKCTKCKEEKEESLFGNIKKFPDGTALLKRWCKKCENDVATKRYRKKAQYKLVDNLEGEIWIPVRGYEDQYAVSNKSRIKSLVIIGYRNSEQLMGFHKGEKGYMAVRFKDGLKAAHRIIAIAFIPNPKNYDQINHINGIKDDNKVENLEWCNGSQNQSHAISLGLRKLKGMNAMRRILTDVQAIEIYNSDLPNQELGDKYGVSRHAIQKIKVGKNWASVTGGKCKL